MSFNWNSVNIFVRPTKAGQAASVFLDPENSYTQLINKVKTSKGSGQNIIVDRSAQKKSNQITVSGSIGESNSEVVIYKNITQPDLWAGENLKSFLNQRQVVLTGEVKNCATPAKAKVLAESESKPIEHILADMNKFSNN
jgi:D-alanyl-D-alanine carboxypeptidase/D-alanyl-D-alanine-endopeptidase (penicillin-binding protein 4)